MSCTPKSQHCNVTDFKELNLEPVNTVLKVPSYVITDTVSYGDIGNFFQRDIQSVDSSFILFAGVKSYEKDPEAMPDIDHRMGSQKEQVETGQDSMQLLTQTFKTINTTKVGYLKYFDEKRKRYESRIFFNRGRKFVDVWVFEKYTGNEVNKHTVIDCVFENIRIQ